MQVYAFVVSAVSKDLKSQSKAMQLPMLLSYWVSKISAVCNVRSKVDICINDK